MHAPNGGSVEVEDHDSRKGRLFLLEYALYRHSGNQYWCTKHEFETEIVETDTYETNTIVINFNLMILMKTFNNKTNNIPMLRMLHAAYKRLSD